MSQVNKNKPVTGNEHTKHGSRARCPTKTASDSQTTISVKGYKAVEHLKLITVDFLLCFKLRSYYLNPAAFYLLQEKYLLPMLHEIMLVQFLYYNGKIVLSCGHFESAPKHIYIEASNM